MRFGLEAPTPSSSSTDATAHLVSPSPNGGCPPPPRVVTLLGVPPKEGNSVIAAFAFWA